MRDRFYKIMVHNKAFKMKLDYKESKHLGDALMGFERSLKSLLFDYDNDQELAEDLIGFESSVNVFLQNDSHLDIINGANKAIIEFEFDKGFDNPRYKGLKR